MRREPLAGGGAERFDEVQVIMGRYRGAVPQVGRQQRQLGFDIGSGPVPAQQGIHSKGMAKVVDPRQLAFRSNDAACSKEGLDRVSVTPDLLKRVEMLIFLVTGRDKRDAVSRLMKDPDSLVAGRAVHDAAAVQLWTA